MKTTVDSHCYYSVFSTVTHCHFLGSSADYIQVSIQPRDTTRHDLVYDVTEGIVNLGRLPCSLRTRGQDVVNFQMDLGEKGCVLYTVDSRLLIHCGVVLMVWCAFYAHESTQGFHKKEYGWDLHHRTAHQTLKLHCTGEWLYVPVCISVCVCLYYICFSRIYTRMLLLI